MNKTKKLFRAAISLCLALSLIISLCSCLYSDELIPCVDIVTAMTELEVGLPAGKIYSHSAKEGEIGYIPDSLLSSLFGGGEMITLFDGWIDYAFFMPSSAHPCEFVVILCDTPTTAKDTARLLSRRLNTLRNANKSNISSANRANADSTYHLETVAYLDNAAVTISRNYVLLIISSDTPAAKKKALAMIG